VRADIDTVGGTGITCRGSNLGESAKTGRGHGGEDGDQVLVILGPLAAYLRFWLFREEIIESAERRSFVILRWSSECCFPAVRRQRSKLDSLTLRRKRAARRPPQLN
jgi:hypothetical protein